MKSKSKAVLNFIFFYLHVGLSPEFLFLRKLRLVFLVLCLSVVVFKT